MLYRKELHESLTKKQWSKEVAENAVSDIVVACLSEFQNEKLWPVHPDLQKSYGVKSPLTGLWIGAAGTIAALIKLSDINPKLPKFDFSNILHLLASTQATSLAEFAPAFTFELDSPSYLFGTTGVDLLRSKVTKAPELLDKLEYDIKRNIHRPENELMWAAPGTMLVAWFLYQETQEERWAQLFQQSAEYLFSTWKCEQESNCHLWTQEMYGARWKFLGLVHGFAGTISVLLQGIKLLTSDQRKQLIEKAQDTFIKTAHINNNHANWLPCVGLSTWVDSDKMFLQLCHGSPGMLIGLSKLWPYMNAEAKDIYLKGAQLIWDAGPLKKPWGLCHGTAGNGYALLKAYTLTGDAIWLDRARSFAMHAIEQSKIQQAKYGCIRTDHWCGDLGLALYLQDCIAAKSDFPLLDVF